MNNVTVGIISGRHRGGACSKPITSFERNYKLSSKSLNHKRESGPFGNI